jgi:hypothetical protein
VQFRTIGNGNLPLHALSRISGSAFSVIVVVPAPSVTWQGQAPASYKRETAFEKILWLRIDRRWRTMMAKETKTKKELEDMIMAEARASGKCAGLQNVHVLGPETRLYTNWNYSTTAYHPAHLLSPGCRNELNMIVARLQAKYDLADN